MKNSINPKIYVINLKRDKHKLTAIESQLNKLKLNYEIIEAFDGATLSESSLETLTDQGGSRSVIGRSLTKGEVGCALSHRKIYEKLLESDNKYAIILEDDVIISSKINQLFSCDNNLPSKLDVLLLGYYNNPNTEKQSASSFWKYIKIGSSFKCLRLIENAYGTHGYLITREGARKLLRDTEILVEPIDHYTGNFNKYRVYGINKILVSLDPIYSKMSNISADRNKKEVNGNSERKMKNIKLFIRKLFPIKDYN
ncbi:glycosyltransferase family 25 protein [Vibrio natriegens]|uniref:glycosyltransferase family 25 protein n=1 Tax=Vibrio natriegens TaxID=691 RepID=UPI001FB8EB80|nr:glycosyltransferase family 25 protein [Vibrio natriegens]